MNSRNKKNREEENRNIQKMAVLLREGNTLLSDACPQCNSPLFKMKSSEIYCVSCDKKVIIVKDDEQIDNIMQNKILDDLSKVISMKIKQLFQQIDSEKDLDDLYKITRILLNYLELLDKLKQLKKD